MNEPDKNYYMAFTASITVDAARAAFIARYGVEPVKAVTWPKYRLVVAGPIPEKERTK